MRTDDDLARAIIDHWRHRADLGSILRDLQAKGHALDALTAEALAPHDQLHAGGLEATRVFAEWSRVPRGARVLDLGAGLGGPARLLASDLDCRVTALDLSPELTEAGQEITRWRGLPDRVEHVAGVLDDLPASAVYEVIWIQHLDIHLPDKPAFYTSCREHLAPDGRVVWHDWLAGRAGPARPPLPWSRDGSLSFLASEAELRTLIAGAGLNLRRLEHVVERTTGWYRKLERSLGLALDRQSGPGGSGRRAHLEALLAETRGVISNLDEGRLLPFFGEAHRDRAA